MQVAVIGAGLAGLSAALVLREHGAGVVVLEKGRGVGGRTSTRRTQLGSFDHGAPFLHDLPADVGGIELDAGGRPVGTPGSSAPAKRLALGLDVRTATRVATLERERHELRLHRVDGSTLGRFDRVVVSAPAPQAAELLSAVEPELAERAQAVVFDPCWAALVAWRDPLDLPPELTVDGLSWALAQGPRPGRDAGERWVLQADPALSRNRLEDDPDAVAAALVARFTRSAGRDLPPSEAQVAHRWRFSRPATPLAQDHLISEDGLVAVAGDWCGGDSAGAAVRSGRAAAHALLTAVGEPMRPPPPAPPRPPLRSGPPPARRSTG